MAYLDESPVKIRILEDIQTKLRAIAVPDYHLDMREVTIFDSVRIVLGKNCPCVAIVPEQDKFIRTLSCQVDEREAMITLVGAIRIMRRDELWKKESHWLVSDIKRAISQDIQLSSTAIYSEFDSEDTYEVAEESIALVTVGLRVVYRHLSQDPTATVSA